MSRQVDDQARKLVMEILADPILNAINFSVPRFSIRPGFYKKVRDAVSKGDITIRVDPTRMKPGTGGQYKPEFPLTKTKTEFDVILLPSATLGVKPAEWLSPAGTIVHECTHAGFDMLKISGMTRLENEILAHIAHYTFIWAKLVQLKAKPSDATQPNKIKKAAWVIAEQVYNKQPISHWSYLALATHIYTSPLYTVDMLENSNNDGVGRPTIGRKKGN